MATRGIAHKCLIIFQSQASLAQNCQQRLSVVGLARKGQAWDGRWQQQRGLASKVHTGGLNSSRLTVEAAGLDKIKSKPAIEDLTFGKIFTDHMLTIEWTQTGGWENPEIKPFTNFNIHPGAKVLHYAQELFEGMKAYRGVDDKIRMFRPMHNMARMNVTAERACLPNFDGHELMECIRKLVMMDVDWVPHCTSSSLYIRPTMIGTEAALGVAPSIKAKLYVILCPVGPYYSTGFKPVNLLADPQYVRAWEGGCGFTKMGSNYAPTLWTQNIAQQNGCHQCLWLFGPDHEITEVGAMNLFILLRRKDGTRELVTSPLTSGIILPGVTRRSIIEMVSTWPNITVSERKITMGEVLEARQEGRLLEMFGSGTAAIVTPVGGLHYGGQMWNIPTSQAGLASKVFGAMTDIYYGKVFSPWAIDVEEWNIDQDQELEDYKQLEALRS